MVSSDTAVRPGAAVDVPLPARSARRPVAVAAVALVVLAGLGGGAAFWTLRHHPAAPPRHRQHVITGPTRPAVAVPPPGCSQSVGTAPYHDLTPSRVASVPEPPYGAVVTADDSYTFVALSQSIELFRNRNGAPSGSPVRRIAVPDHPHAQALTSDNAYLVTATNHGAAVISVRAAESGHGRLVAGFLSSHLPGNPGGDDLALSADDRFAFVAMRWADKIAVFDLAKALRTGFGPADLVGYIPAGVKPHGMLVSGNGRWLYVANRFAQQGSVEGSVSVFSVRTAEINPARSFLHSAIVGCGAYRIIASPDGSVLWVIAQSSNAVVAVSAARLRSDPAHAILATVRVGPIPLDEVLVNGGTRLLVTDNSGPSLAVIDPGAALAGHGGGLVAFVRTPPLPRFFAYVPGAPNVLLVTGDAAGQIRALTVGKLP